MKKLAFIFIAVCCIQTTFHAQNVEYFTTEKDSLFGLVDSRGNQLVAPKYNTIGKFDAVRKSWAKITKSEFVGFINKEGKEVVPPKYHSIEAFDVYKKGWALVRLNAKALKLYLLNMIKLKTLMFIKKT